MEWREQRCCCIIFLFAGVLFFLITIKLSGDVQKMLLYYTVAEDVVVVSFVSVDCNSHVNLLSSSNNLLRTFPDLDAFRQSLNK